MTQSTCKRDTKSRSHLGMKLAPVRGFSCKRPLQNVVITHLRCEPTNLLFVVSVVLCITSNSTRQLLYIEV